MRFNGAGTHIALAAFAILYPVTTAAQTRFPAPDTTVDFVRYTTAEDCLAAVGRVRHDLDRQKLSAMADTLPYDPAEALAPAPAAVNAVAARCAARFAGATIDLRDFRVPLELFLAAGRDSDAAAVVARRLSAIAPNDTVDRAKVTDTVVQIYVEARPSRLAAAEAILVRRARGSAERIERLRTYSKLLVASGSAGDTARARRVARSMLAVSDSLTPAERRSEQFEEAHVPALMFLAVKILAGLEPRLDSLRKSTAAFVGLEQAYWSQVTGERGDALPDVGKRAEALTADYWFPSAAGTVPHPTPGSATLIVLVTPTQCMEQVEFGDFVGWACDHQLAQLRRIAHRFPALHIDVVMSTRGAYMYVPPPAPADEAALLAKWLDNIHVPGAVLSVTSTPFFKLQEPDGRRINRDVPNLVHYHVQEGAGVTVVIRMFLAGADGTIIEGGAPYVGAWDETELTQMIDAVLKQGKPGT
jgi:hypothetical protein